MDSHQRSLAKKSSQHHNTYIYNSIPLFPHGYLSTIELSISISTHWWVSLLAGQRSLKAHRVLQSTSLNRSVLPLSNLLCRSIIPFGFIILYAFWQHISSSFGQESLKGAQYTKYPRGSYCNLVSFKNVVCLSRSFYLYSIKVIIKSPKK